MRDQFLEKIQLGDTYLIRMMPDEDIIAGIKKFCEKRGIRRAVINSGVGSAKEVVIRDPRAGAKIPVEPSKVNEINLMGPYEICALEGNVFPLEDEIIVHLHITLGSEDGTVYGGHVMRAKVWTTLELILTEIYNSRCRREKSKVTGLNELLFD